MATKRHSRGISRRSFVQGSLAATLAAGSSLWLEKNPVAHADESSDVSDEQVFSGVCRGDCYGGCHLNVYVRDGKIVRTSARELPEKAWTRICAKGLTHVFRVYDPNRAKYPMRRVGERGEGKWEQISWDEALTEIADKFTSYAQEFGPSSIAFRTGAGNFGFADNMTRFQNTIGASTLAAPIDTAPFFSINQVVGQSLNFNGNEMTDLKNAKTIVIWGSNPAVSQIQGMHFIEEAREQGSKVICVDPVYTATVAKSDQWIPIAPGTDGLLAIAIMNIILREGWEDTDFIRRSTVAPFLVKDDGSYLMMSDLGRADAGSDADVQVVTDGQGNFGSPNDIADPAYQGSFDYNGTHVRCAWELLVERLSQYSVDDAVRICNIPEDVIEGLAYDIAVNKPATLYIILGIDHYENGFYSLYDMACITALTGNIGKPGAFCGSSEFIPLFFGNTNGKYGPMPPNPQVSTVAVPAFAAKEAIDSGQWMGKPYNLKALWIYRFNLLQNLADREYNLSWLDEVPFIVVSEVTMNEMGRYADIFLPVCHWFECEDVGHTCPQNVFLEYNEKAIDPLYETKSDFDIVKELATKMGYGDEFDFTVDDYLREYLSSDALKASGFDYDELKRRKAMRALPGSEDHPFIHGENGIPTPTGRVQFYIEPSKRQTNFPLEQKPDLSHFGLPYWEAPGQVGVEGHPGKYPYQVMSDHQRLRTHTQWVNVDALRELDPEPTVKLNPQTAEEAGIAENDYARIFNDNGEVVMRAHLSDGVRPGVLLCSRGWEDKDFVEGHLQDVLSKDVSNVCVTLAVFDVTANIEKAQVN